MSGWERNGSCGGVAESKSRAHIDYTSLIVRPFEFPYGERFVSPVSPCLPLLRHNSKGMLVAVFLTMSGETKGGGLLLYLTWLEM